MTFCFFWGCWLPLTLQFVILCKLLTLFVSLDTCSSKNKKKKHKQEDEGEGKAQKKKSKKTEKVNICLPEVMCLH